jgi:nucleotide-binding universal stress UspA family protein
MPNLKHILFPVDFSEQNCSVAPYVACMASRYGARVTVLHVVEIPTGGYPEWPAQASLVDFEDVATERKQRLDSFLNSEFQSVAASRVMLEGDPARMISEHADRHNVDLIMMPTHGYGPFRRFLLGSITAKVLHDVKCPVWTSAHLPERAAPPAGYRSMLCAVDLTPKSVSLIQWAAAFAREHGATLRLLHAIPAAEPTGGIDIEGKRFRAMLVEVAREELAKMQQQAKMNLEVPVEAGDVAPVVHRAAELHHADLVVIGRGVMQEVFGRMRTHVYSVIREAPCPVISV